MQGNRIYVPVHIGGTLAANQQGKVFVPLKGLTLEAIYTVSSNAGSATLQVGTADDADGILKEVAIGVSGTPVIFDHTDWDGDEYLAQKYLGVEQDIVAGVDRMRLEKHDHITWALDYDGDGGTAAQNVDLLFVFSEG